MGILELVPNLEVLVHRVEEQVDQLGLAECSMGMSADLEIAVDEGATMVRIGRDLFGERTR